MLGRPNRGMELTRSEIEQTKLSLEIYQQRNVDFDTMDEYWKLALRTATLLNAGGVVAPLAFLGNIMLKDADNELLAIGGAAVGAFTLGAIAASFSHFAGFMHKYSSTLQLHAHPIDSENH